jgi:alkylhydroperoxidase family enzyme
VGRALGLSDERLAAIGRWRESDFFTARERLALELSDAMTDTPATVTDDLRERLRAEFTPAQLAELASVIAWENHRARLNRALGVRAVGFSDGAYCVLPVPQESSRAAIDQAARRSR